MAPDTSRSGAANPVMAALAVLHPFFFAAAFVLDRFSATNASGHELVRPLVAAVVLAGILITVGWVVLRRGPSAALFASIAFLMLVVHPVPALVMLGVWVWWVAISTRRRLGGHRWLVLTTATVPIRLAAGYSVVLFAIGLWSATTALIPRVESRFELPTPSEQSRAGDVFVLMLDGYPRTDTLAHEFDWDNTAFESQLADLGFVVGSRAEANYNKTWLTTASLFNADYVHEVPAIASPPAEIPAQVRLAEELINGGAVTESFRANGYDVVSIPSQIRTTDITVGAEVRAPSGLNSLEISIVTASLPSWVFPGQTLDVLAADFRAYLQTQLTFLSREAPPVERPRLIWTHIMTPHPPFLLGQEPDYLRGCFPSCKLWETTVDETRMTEAEYLARMRSQVEELNDLVVKAISDVVRLNPDATVILLSDHGARHHIGNLDEHFRIFFAARAGQLEVEFPEDVSPVNVFRRVLSAAFELPLADLQYEAWVSDWSYPLSLSRYR